MGIIKKTAQVANAKKASKKAKETVNSIGYRLPHGYEVVKVKNKPKKK